MKKLLVLMVVALSFIALSALEDGATIFLGAGMSWLSGIPADTQNGNLGFGGGFTYQKYIFDEKWVYEPGIRWMQRGMDSSMGEGDDAQDIIINTSYLDLFIKVKPVFGHGNFSVQPYFGPNVAFLMIAKDNSDEDQEVDARDLLKSPMLSLLLGCDFLLWDMINIGLEYDYGISFVLPGQKVISNTALLNIGYKF